MNADRGSVRWRRNGWELRFQADGRRRTKRLPGVPNTRAGRRQAEAALDALVRSIDVGTEADTVADLLDRYATARAPHMAASTRKDLPNHLRALKATLGDVAVEDLRLHHIEAAYGEMMAEGKKPSTVRRHHSVLGPALTHAVRWGVIAASPAHGVQIPRAACADIADLPDLATAVAAVDQLANARPGPDEKPKPAHARLHVAGRPALGTGARRGELAAFRWRDIHLNAATVLVAAAISDGERTRTKTGRAATISIDPALVVVLRRWRTDARQLALQLGHRLVDDDPVLFAPTDPTAPWDPTRVTRAWQHHRTSVGLPVRWHDLRHIHATALLRAGVPVHVVAYRLRHASPKMTLDVYAHVLVGDDRAAVAALERAADLQPRRSRPTDGVIARQGA